MLEFLTLYEDTIWHHLYALGFASFTTLSWFAFLLDEQDWKFPKSFLIGLCWPIAFCFCIYVGLLVLIEKIRGIKDD